jgi:1,4-dihydroxy-2-naphthoate octaprenyltransferase
LIQAYVKAARLRTLPLALAGIALGAGLSAFSAQAHNWTITWLAILTATLLQILSNFANDYGDFKSGVDADRSDRTLASGGLSQKSMRNAILILSAATILVGLLLLYVSFGTLNWAFIVLFLVGLAAVYAALKYTAGKNPYGYRALGDLAVFVFFGLVSVIGVYFLQLTNSANQKPYEFAVSWLLKFTFQETWMPATCFGLLSVGVLNINNIRDIEGDRENNKITLAVQLGRKKAEWYQLVLIAVAFGFLALFLNKISGLKYWSCLLLFPVYLFNWLVLRNLDPTDRSGYNGQLKKMVMLNAFLVLILLLTLLV